MPGTAKSFWRIAYRAVGVISNNTVVGNDFNPGTVPLEVEAAFKRAVESLFVPRLDVLVDVSGSMRCDELNSTLDTLVAGCTGYAPQYLCPGAE